MVSTKIGYMLAKLGTKTIFRPRMKIKQILESVKTNLELRVLIPCKCGLYYMARQARQYWTGTKSMPNVKRRYYPDKSALVQHSLETWYKIFGSTAIFYRSVGLGDRIYGKSIEILLEKRVLNI